ncbi:MAG: YdeI/OmpD-associated family protein [Octadecabacter sp.]|nr:YdeI/OmpD-associated family protein [Octadecabacter sp.]
MALTRDKNPMPDFVATALAARGLQPAFEARPAYQQNDWLGWIAHAKHEDTRQRRLEKMLSELAAGHGYMGMEWQPKPPKEPAN